MKKIISLIVVAAMGMALFTGCGGSTAKTDTAAASTAKSEAPAAATSAKSEAPAAAASSTAEASAPAETEAPAEAPAASSGETYTLMVANHDASTSMCELYVETICNMMSEESGGRLQFVFNPGGSLLGGTETLDGVKDGAADMCWATPAFYSGRMPIMEFVGLAGNGLTSARFATDVIQQMYEEIPEFQEELKDWKIISLYTTGITPICTVGKKIEKPEDLAGLQIRAAGTIPTQYINALGAVAVSMPTTDTYESLEKGVLDGMANDYHNIDCFKLYEPIDYCFNYPINLSGAYLLMNKDLYESMDDELKAVIDKFSNGYAAAMGAYWWDSCNYWVQDEMKENGVEIVEPSQEFIDWATSDEIVQPIHEWYVQYLNDAGYDGQAIYDKCMAIVEENKPNHEHDWDAPFNYTDWDKTPEDFNK